MKKFVSILLALAFILSVLLLPQNTQANSPRFEKATVTFIVQKAEAVGVAYPNFRTNIIVITRNDFPKEENMIQPANKYALVFNGVQPKFVKLE